MSDDISRDEIEEMVRQKKPATKEVTFAPNEKVKALFPWTEEVRKALCLRSWFVTDKTLMGDFEPVVESWEALSVELGVAVKPQDTLADVATRLKAKVTGR